MKMYSVTHSKQHWKSLPFSSWTESPLSFENVSDFHLNFTFSVRAKCVWTQDRIWYPDQGFQPKHNFYMWYGWNPQKPLRLYPVGVGCNRSEVSGIWVRAVKNIKGLQQKRITNICNFNLKCFFHKHNIDMNVEKRKAYSHVNIKDIQARSVTASFCFVADNSCLLLLETWGEPSRWIKSVRMLVVKAQQ